MVKREKLFDQFPPVTTKEWMDRINSDLKGGDFNKKLVWKTGEGFEVNPFYRLEDIRNIIFINTSPGRFPYIRGTKKNSGSWLIRQDMEVSDYQESNRKALSLLKNGVDSPGFIITDPASVTEGNFRILLRDIRTDSTEVNFLSNGKAKEIIEFIIGDGIEKGIAPSEIKGAVEADPIGRLMLNGTLCITVSDGFDYLASVTRSAAAYPGIRTINLNASVFKNAGLDLVSELAFALSEGCEYLVQLTERGVAADIAASSVRFSFGIGSDYFPEIAKLRAARLLWSVVTNAFEQAGREAVKMNIHCMTSRWNKTVYDPYVNMLRTQTEAMSAVIGGTDSLTVEPFDICFRKPDEFSERIARNQQLILKEEAYFDKVADPAGGSYYVEKLTRILAENAWKVFIELEEQGGFLESLKSGFVNRKISESSARRKNDVALRKTVLLGTNQYPDPGERIPERTDEERLSGKKAVTDDMLVTPVRLFRGAEEFEKIRMAVEKSPKRPSVFLLQVGNVLMRRARAQFSAGFFGCAGYRIIDNNGFNTVEEGIAAALDSGAEIVVICSSDEEYATVAPEIAGQLKGKVILVVAGDPACKDELKSAGLEIFIHVRSNVPEVLAGFSSMAGILS
jgi:methylmalonyl-CoA mutase